MNLVQALKTKNRLAGELVRLQNILQRENSRRSDNPSKVNCEEVYKSIIDLSDRLGLLKSQIAAANINIYPAIERMSELKSRISYLNSLPKREGEEICFVGRDNEKLVYTWDCYLNQEEVDSLVVKLQEECDRLQDTIDNFNATTQISEN